MRVHAQSSWALRTLVPIHSPGGAQHAARAPFGTRCTQLGAFTAATSRWAKAMHRHTIKTTSDATKQRFDEATNSPGSWLVESVFVEHFNDSIDELLSIRLTARDNFGPTYDDDRVEFSTACFYDDEHEPHDRNAVVPLCRRETKLRTSLGKLVGEWFVDWHSERHNVDYTMFIS